MEIIKTLDQLSAFQQNNQGQVTALVPTMGALHEGHLTLVRQAKNIADSVISSIFVNPTQFAPGEDLDTYPTSFDQDVEKLQSLNIDALWAPDATIIYPNGLETDIRVMGITEMLEGEHRPHFFDGVATVVQRLFQQVKPNKAIFGEKDYQQLLVIKKMVLDNKMPIDIIGVPTIRDKNGLALSSRNSYLNDDQYHIAIQLNKILGEMAEKSHAQIMSRTEIEKWGENALLEAGFDRVDYCTIRCADTLQAAEKNKQSLRILAAAWIDKTRLIDNISL